MIKRIVWPLALVLACLPSLAAAATYYVDFDSGNDNNSGTLTTTPWKRAPGDPAATGVAAAATLFPGDIVRFKGGVTYRGSIRARFDGVAGNPIVYAGSGFGSGNAIISGADPVTSITLCSSAAECGGSTRWQSMSVVTFTPPATSFVKFYDNSGILYESQSPAPVDRFYSDEIAQFAVSPLADKAMIESGRINAPTQAALLNGVPSGSLQIWVTGNLVVRRPVTGVVGNVIHFDPAGITLYDDRSGRFALTGVATAISAAGQYALAGPGRAFVLTRPSGGLVVGNGRGGFDLADRSHITVIGFIFRHHTADTASQGAPITRTGRTGTGLLIDSNRFEHESLWDGKGVITLSNVTSTRVTRNTISRIERGSGVRVGAGTATISITGNKIDTVGRTGIALLGASDSSVSDNIITNLKGAHGNGISLYLNNRRTKVINNRVLNTDRPMTFHGDKDTTGPGDHDFLIERNIFIATTTAQAALTSWGAATRGVTIRNNVAIGPKGGMLMNDTDLDVAITRNFVSGIIYTTSQPANWTVAGNVIAAPTVRYIANDPVNNALLCTGASVAPGVLLGGVVC
jgi:Right handed beta helix region